MFLQSSSYLILQHYDELKIGDLGKYIHFTDGQTEHHKVVELFPKAHTVVDKAKAFPGL
jgi:hypothetical protein